MPRDLPVKRGQKMHTGYQDIHFLPKEGESAYTFPWISRSTVAIDAHLRREGTCRILDFVFVRRFRIALPSLILEISQFRDARRFK